MTRNMIEMHKADTRKAFEAMIRKAQGERAAVLRSVAVLRSKAVAGYMIDNTAKRAAMLDREIARLQAEADKALAKLDEAARVMESTEAARRAREAFTLACIEEGIDDFTAQVA
jgi:hypothetical protein